MFLAKIVILGPILLHILYEAKLCFSVKNLHFGSKLVKRCCFKSLHLGARYPEVNIWMITRFSCLRRSPLKTSSVTKSSKLWPLRNHLREIVKSPSWIQNLAANAVASNVKVAPRTDKADKVKGPGRNQRHIALINLARRQKTSEEKVPAT